MKKINVTEHNQKYFEFGKKCANGEYPSKKIAKIGSRVGLGVGSTLIVIGGVALFTENLWGIVTIVIGCVTIFSNIINLKRLSS